MLFRSVTRLRAYGLEIRFCENLRSYKKIIPALQEYPDAILVTADDDWLYTQDWLAGLWHPYERHPHDIHACRSPAFPHPGRLAPALRGAPLPRRSPYLAGNKKGPSKEGP